MERKSRWARLLNNPLRRIYGLAVSKLIFRLIPRVHFVKARLVFDKQMTVSLPDGLDIYLCGCKSHDSEIRFAKWMIRNLGESEIFFDVGAHFGFFSLLASTIVKTNGKVFSFEPSDFASNILLKNISGFSNVKSFPLVVSDKSGEEFFSERDAGNTEASGIVSENENGKKIKSVSLDEFCMQEKIFPTTIKIDAEGSELKVLSGMKSLLINHRPKIIMEFWSKNFHENSQHLESINFLKSLEYKLNLIDDSGNLFISDDAEHFCRLRNLESDNIVFTR